MKNSINSIPFDDIFAERGKEVKVEDLVKGQTYLASGYWDWLLVFDGLERNGNVKYKSALPSDGQFEEWSGDFKAERLFFEATENQIKLLKSYLI